MIRTSSSLQAAGPDLDALLGPAAVIEHCTRRRFFEKRIVLFEQQRFVLYRFMLRPHAAKLAWLLRTGQAVGVPLQRHVAGPAGWGGGLLQGGFWVAASYEAGEYLAGCGSEGVLAQLGIALARLNSIEHRRAGALFRMGRPWESYRQTLLRELFASAPGESLQDQAHSDLTRAWVEGHSAFLDDLPLFQLAHGDLYGRNILVRADSICLIDYELARFEPAGMELATALLRAFCGQQAPLRHALLQAYLEHAPSHVVEAWNAHYPFYLVAAACRLTARRLFRAHRLGEMSQDPADTLRMASVYMQWAGKLMHAADSALRPSAEEMLEGCM